NNQHAIDWLIWFHPNNPSSFQPPFDLRGICEGYINLKSENTAFADFTLDANIPPHQLDILATDGQPQTCAFKGFFAAAGLDKGVEKVFHFCFGNTGASIFNLE